MLVLFLLYNGDNIIKNTLEKPTLKPFHKTALKFLKFKFGTKSD